MRPEPTEAPDRQSRASSGSRSRISAVDPLDVGEQRGDRLALAFRDLSASRLGRQADGGARTSPMPGTAVTVDVIA
jgi:hypothetical protein